MDNDELKKIESTIRELFNDKKAIPQVRMNNALRYLSKYRSQLISNTLIQEHGLKVINGPFKDMEFLSSVSEGCYLPKILGIYESELHSLIEAVVESKPDVILNIGCAEGYYAVGFKRLLTETEVYAFDINPFAQSKCKELSERNNVVINIQGEFKIEMMKDFYNKKVFLMCDIEGAEADLFNKDSIELLSKVEICIELHRYKGKSNIDIIPDLFRKSHNVEIVYQNGKDFTVPEIIKNLQHLDILLSAWEWRSYPTPWLVAKPIKNV